MAPKWMKVLDRIPAILEPNEKFFAWPKLPVHQSSQKLRGLRCVPFAYELFHTFTPTFQVTKSQTYTVI